MGPRKTSSTARARWALGIVAEDALFVDDMPDNVGAAAVLGMQTFLFTGDDGVDELRRRLAHP
jgi:FMN phosphatase YigB (HAD superfamily)